MLDSKEYRHTYSINMKKYLIVLADGSKQYAFSEKTYRVGEFFSYVGLVLEII